MRIMGEQIIYGAPAVGQAFRVWQLHVLDFQAGYYFSFIEGKGEVKWWTQRRTELE